MEKYIVNEWNGLEYELVGDYYIIAGEDEPSARPIGVWGAMRRDYLKQYRKNLYYELLLSGKLNDHLAGIEEQAQDMMRSLIEQMKKSRRRDRRIKTPGSNGEGRCNEQHSIPCEGNHKP